MSESYPIGKKGLAFKGSIQKLEVLVAAGILRKIETELLEFVEGESVMETKYTFEDWTKIIQEKVVVTSLVQAESDVEETKVSQEVITNMVTSPITQVESTVEETKVLQEVVVEEKKDNKKDSKEKKDNKKDSKTSKEKKNLQ